MTIAFRNPSTSLRSPRQNIIAEGCKKITRIGFSALSMLRIPYNSGVIFWYCMLFQNIIVYEGRLNVSFPKFVCSHDWTEWNQINRRIKFWVAGYTVKISIRTVQYVARCQYADMKHAIQMYSAVEVQNRSTIDMHKKLCAVYSRLMALWSIHCTQLFVYLRCAMVSYGVKSYYVGCTLSLSVVGEILEQELHEMRPCECDFLHSCRELSIHEEWEQG